MSNDPTSGDSMSSVLPDGNREPIHSIPSVKWIELESPYSTTREESVKLLKVFWLLTIGLAFVFLMIRAPIESTAAAFLIAGSALLPSYLWCAGRAKGMPIFPLLAIPYVWTCAFPLVAGHWSSLQYLPSEHLAAAAKIAFFLLLGTTVWFMTISRPTKAPKTFWGLERSRVDAFFLWFLVGAITYQIAFNAGWLWVLPQGVHGLLRACFLGLNLVGVFGLSYKLGKGALSRKKRITFLCMFCLYLLVITASLLLVESMLTFALSVSAYVMGRKKLPWRVLILALVCASFLHTTKGEMRTKYWLMEGGHSLQPWEYVDWYTEWVGFGLQSVSLKDIDSLHAESGVEKYGTSLITRSGMIHLLLHVQSVVGQETPYLYGKTYSGIPEMLIPRILMPNKKNSGEGSKLLSTHFFGPQGKGSSKSTTVGWGLLNESYANFGIVGCALLAVILGSTVGMATRWSMYTPVLSYRALFSVMLMAMALKMESTAGVYVTALFQASAALTGFCFLSMRRYTLHSIEGFSVLQAAVEI